MDQSLADRLAQLRQAHHLSCEELSAKLHVQPEAVQGWEAGLLAPDVDALKGLSTLYGMDLDTLLDPHAPATTVSKSWFDAQRSGKRAAFPYPVLVTFLYLILGFVFNLWHPGWIIFLTIPLFYLPDSQRSPLRLLCNPVMVTIIYLLLGIECNLWHPGWLIFLAIPLFSAAIK